MNITDLQYHLERFRCLRIGVLGDFCVDAYWLLDETDIEPSVETRRPTHAVCRQSYSLGGASNVVGNLVALGLAEIKAFGVIGDDIFGREMLDLLHRQTVDTAGMIVQADGWATSVYAKPYIGFEEQDRIDFARFNVLAHETANRLLAALEPAMDKLDGLVINQQICPGIHSDYLIAGLQRLIDRHADKTILIDARDVSGRYRGVVSKLNAGEAARLCGQTREVGPAVGVEELIGYARSLFSRTHRPVVITRGDRGILGFDGQEVYQVPGVLIVGDTDPVGAGDTTASAVTVALTAGLPLSEAIEVGNLAAAVVVQKLRQTGTATSEEILALAAECDFVHRPELAEDIRQRRFWSDSEIEIISEARNHGPLRHVIFDHDGTISTLRQGWEQIMEPVMVRAILGRRYQDAPEELYQRVVQRVREYIDQSTGIETIVQMQALEKMVRQFGMVEARDILDPTGYKGVYNAALMAVVHQRTEKLRRGELDTGDYTVKGAVVFLHALHDCGVKLYLASGTDHADVVREAESLGYAGLFEGRIYG